MDPWIIYGLPNLFLENLRNDPMTAPIFKNIEEHRFNNMITHIFMYISRDNISNQELETIIKAHQNLHLSSEMSAAWVCCLESALKQMNINDTDLNRFVKRTLILTKELVNDHPIKLPISLLDDLIKMINTTEQLNKKDVLSRLDSLKDLLLLNC